MLRKLFLAALLIVSLARTPVVAATPFHTDDFQSGTTEGWSGGATRTILSGGQAGPSDQFLRLQSTGGFGPGSRLSTYNISSDWIGDFAVAGIQSVSVDLMNPIDTETSLDMRLVLLGPPVDSERWTSTVPAVVPNDGIWRRYDFAVDETSLSRVAGFGTFQALMGDVSKTMLRHDEIGDAGGTEIAARINIDNVTLNGILEGDFDRDLDLDIDDIDSLVVEIVAANQNVAFDLTGDGMVDLADLTQWRVLGGARNLPGGTAYLPGDADLSGSVDVTDFDIWNANRFTMVTGWSHGDFNADGSADISDFHQWNDHKSIDDGTFVVPEPSSYWWLTITLFLTSCGSRLQNRNALVSRPTKAGRFTRS